MLLPRYQGFSPKASDRAFAFYGLSSDSDIATVGGDDAVIGKGQVYGARAILPLPAGELIPAIIQEQKTGRVLMMAWMNRASLESTIATGKTHFWSRSRQSLWLKGETSGHLQDVQEVLYDCDADTLLYRVRQKGPACHTGERTCFYRSAYRRGGETA